MGTTPFLLHLYLFLGLLKYDTMKKIFVVAVVFLAANMVRAQKTITFPSKDGLTITADYYQQQNAGTMILLFHQAGWSRGEYKEIAPKLNAMGYSCLAVDLRSGGEINNIKNQTHARAASQGQSTEFKDAIQDIDATIAYVKKTYAPKKVILWGSSYSSSLVLKHAGDHPDDMSAVLSFAPGEYFGSKDYIAKSVKNITVPTFITSSKGEYSNWKAIHGAIPTKTKTSYLPKTKGNHGSRALWEKFDDHKGYWDAVGQFLKSVE